MKIAARCFLVVLGIFPFLNARAGEHFIVLPSPHPCRTHLDPTTLEEEESLLREERRFLGESLVNYFLHPSGESLYPIRNFISDTAFAHDAGLYLQPHLQISIGKNRGLDIRTAFHLDPIRQVQALPKIDLPIELLTALQKKNIAAECHSRKPCLKKTARIYLGSDLPNVEWLVHGVADISYYMGSAFIPGNPNPQKFLVVDHISVASPADHAAPFTLKEIVSTHQKLSPTQDFSISEAIAAQVKEWAQKLLQSPPKYYTLRSFHEVFKRNQEISFELSTLEKFPWNGPPVIAPQDPEPNPLGANPASSEFIRSEVVLSRHENGAKIVFGHMVFDSRATHYLGEGDPKASAHFEHRLTTVRPLQLR